jgi:hypothetical protein
MFFKGRSKPYRIYPPEIVVLSINMCDWNLFAIQLLKLWIAIDIDNLNFKCKLFAKAFENIHSIFAEMTSAAGVNGDHIYIVAP